MVKSEFASCPRSCVGGVRAQWPRQNLCDCGLNRRDIGQRHMFLRVAKILGCWSTWVAVANITASARIEDRDAAKGDRGKQKRFLPRLDYRTLHLYADALSLTECCLQQSCTRVKAASPALTFETVEWSGEHGSSSGIGECGEAMAEVLAARAGTAVVDYLDCVCRRTSHWANHPYGGVVGGRFA